MTCMKRRKRAKGNVRLYSILLEGKTPHQVGEISFWGLSQCCHVLTEKKNDQGTHEPGHNLAVEQRYWLRRCKHIPVLAST